MKLFFNKYLYFKSPCSFDAFFAVDTFFLFNTSLFFLVLAICTFSQFRFSWKLVFILYFTKIYLSDIINYNFAFDFVSLGAALIFIWMSTILCHVITRVIDSTNIDTFNYLLSSSKFLCNTYTNKYAISFENPRSAPMLNILELHDFYNGFLFFIFSFKIAILFYALLSSVRFSHIKIVEHMLASPAYLWDWARYPLLPQLWRATMTPGLSDMRTTITAFGKIKKLWISLGVIDYGNSLFFRKFSNCGSKVIYKNKYDSLKNHKKIEQKFVYSRKSPHYQQISLIYYIFFRIYRFNNYPLIEFIWTIVPAFILMYLAWPSFTLLYQLASPATAISYTIKTVGNQWYWSYEYSTPFIIVNKIENSFVTRNVDLIFKFNEMLSPLIVDCQIVPEQRLPFGYPRLLTTDNVLVLPAGCTIRMLITSNDVIHSWAVPALGIKTDAIPGRINQVYLRGAYFGTTWGQCSELCGVNHAFMPIEIRWLRPQDFEDYVVYLFNLYFKFYK